MAPEDAPQRTVCWEGRWQENPAAGTVLRDVLQPEVGRHEGVFHIQGDEVKYAPGPLQRAVRPLRQLGRPAAVRAGKEERRKFYFGNLDPYRMVANRQFQAPFTVGKAHWRADPYDNQVGEPARAPRPGG